jgi:DNA repair photolyase
MVSQHDVQETITTVAVLEEKIKNLEVLVSKTDSKLKALEKDRDNALKWGIMVLGTLVVSMGSYIFKLLTHSSS